MEIEHYLHEHPLKLCEITDINGVFPCPFCDELSPEPLACSKCGFGFHNECFACDEKISSDFYICRQCWFVFHKACLDLPQEIQIAYRSYCSLYFQRESRLHDILVCDFCNRKRRKIFLCDVCDFKIDLKCVALLFKYQKGREHIEHFSHRHPLAQFEAVDDKNCKLCNERIDGTSYGCVPCGFYIHDTCRQLLEEIQSPLHPRHRLIMDLDEPKEREYQCKACSFNFRGPRYNCVQCEFDLHPGCLSLKPSINYKCHSHLLSLIENMFYESLCEACGFKIQNTFFLRCVECCLDFHVECSPLQLPSTVLHKQHEHPLILRSETGTKVDSHMHYCSVCKKERNLEHPFYCCVAYDYVAHVRCAITELQYNDKGRLRHFSHAHILILRENQKNLDTFCYGCGEVIQGPTYGCDPCKFYLHKSCAELPKEIYGDHQHYLTLKSLEESTCRNYAEHLSGFRYSCHHCKSVDFEWATNHPTNPKSRSIQRKNNDDQKHIGHFSHHHPLIAVEVGDVNCQICYQSINGRSYGCDPCKFYIHNSCSELLQEVNHPFHPLHHLTLRKVMDGKDICKCDICLFNIQGFTYQCEKCDFVLHPSCMSLKPRIKYKDHNHLLVLVENTSWFENCEACGLKVEGAFFMRCVECSLNFHLQCGPLPRLPPSVLYKEHKHPLKLKTETFFEDDSSLFHCDVCHEERNIKHPTYYCGECEYCAHVRCVITEVQVDEEEEMLIHFSHGHALFLLKDKVKEDIICSACDEDIKSDLAYGCHSCKYYLHKSCTKLQEKKHHPFHRHPLTLPKPFSRAHRQCSACLRYCSGFTYHCKDCNFNLDLECVQLYASIKSEDHEHILIFFEKLHASLECRSCTFAPSDKYIRSYMSYLRCVKCNFSIHLMCSSSLPKTVEHDSHHHSLTLGDNCVTTLSDRCYDDEYYCDICETRRDARECVYCCQECSFVVDIDCVISQVMDLIQGKHGNVNPRFRKRITQQVIRKGLSYKDIVHSLTEEEEKMLSECNLQALRDEDVKEFLQQMMGRDYYYIYSLLPKVIKETANWRVKDTFALDDGQLVNVGNYTTIVEHAQLLKNLLDKYGDFGANCALSERLKIISLVTFCDIVREMADCYFKYWDYNLILRFLCKLRFVERAGFEIDFAFDHLKIVAHAVVQVKSLTSKDSPLFKIYEKIFQLYNEIDKLEAEIEKLRKRTQDIVSSHGSERSRLEAQRLNEAIEFLCRKQGRELL